VQFRILGPCEAYHDGSPLPLGGVKQRALLAALLLDAGRVVSADKLIDDLWGEEAPIQARHNLQELISQLRKTLRTAGTDERIVTRTSGYTIELSPGELDLHQFELLVAEGREAFSVGDATTAAAKIAEALALWHGPPLADLAFEGFAQQEIARLEELRMSVIEERIAVDLALGRHAGIVGELQSLAAANPLRERLREQLMLALYRSGRQAEALEAYREARGVLTEELGLDPSPALQRLETAILVHDPELDVPRGESDGSARPPALAPLPDQQTALSARTVRKTVTIVFSALTSSAHLGEQLDPEAMIELMDRYFDEMQAIIVHHGGTVEKVTGDALMAVFGIPTIHEDDALRAVRAVDEMREVRGRMNEELERDRRVTVSARTGVHTGEVVAGDPSAGQRIVIGDAVNVAARIEQSAETGEILIGRTTYRLVKDAVRAEPIEPLMLKGRPQPVHALRLLHVTPGVPGLIRHLDSPMVGRTREFAALQQTFDRVLQENACHLFTVFGSAGVGKSRLMEAFVDALGDHATVLRGRCLPYGEGITFYPLAEALIDVGGLNEADTPQAARAKLAALMGSDSRAERVAECVGQAIGIPGSETAPEETLWAVRMLFERLAAELPVVFVIDDLQWAEPKLLELVEHVADLAQDSPILLACMARPELLDDHPDWAGGKLNATSILLEPLGREESGTLVTIVLAGDGVDEGVRARIVDAAEGHPLYVEEIVALLVEEGRLGLKDGRWVATGDLSEVPVPPTISALLAARIDKLPWDERRVIDIASVMGQVFYPDAVRGLADDVPTLELSLAALVRKQFVRPERSDLLATEALAFRHLLICDAAYDAIPKRVRAELHERFADWLDGVAGAIDERDEMLGYHLERAYRLREELGPVGEHERDLAIRGAEHLASAARSATARVDLLAAAGIYDRAISLLSTHDKSYPELLWELGAALNRSVETDRAVIVLNEAIGLAVSSDDPRLEARARLDLWWARAIGGLGSLIDGMTLEVRTLIPGLEDRGDDLGLTKAWQLLADADSRACHFAAMREPLERALVHARRAGDRLEEAESLASGLEECWWGPLPVSDAIRRCEEILDGSRDDRRVEAMVWGTRGVLQAMLGNFGRARALVNRRREIFQDLGLQYYSLGTSIELWEVEMLAGDPVAAERELRSTYDVLPPADETQARSMLARRLACALHEQGRFEEAAAYADRSKNASEGVMGQILWRGVRAKTLARLGDLDQALGLAKEAVLIAESTDALNVHGDALMDLAEIASMGVVTSTASPVIEEAIALYEQKGNVVSAARARLVLKETRTGDP
jgi:class 3 adenylate cyclase